MKQIIFKLLIAIAGLLVSANAFAYEFSYSIVDAINCTCEIGKNSSETYSGEIVIPSTVTIPGKTGEYTVVRVKQYGFRDLRNITSVILPETITELESWAFSGCTKLESISLNENLTKIRTSAFEDCTSLKTITLPDNLTYLQQAFSNSGITSINIPTKLTNIDAYGNMPYLTSITIPNTVTQIGHGCFNNCSRLTEVIIEDGSKMLYMSEQAFESSPVEYIYLGRNIKDHEQNTFEVKGSTLFQSLSNIDFGPEVTETPHFSECSNILKMFIPDNVTSMKNIYHCENLETLIIGNGVESIGNGVWSGCNNLKFLYLGNSLKSIGSISATNLINVYLFSDVLTTLGTKAIPTTVSRIYVPNTARYENLLNGYYTENLLTIYESETEYTGKVPELSFKNNVEGMNVTFDAETTPTDAGKYSTEVKAIFSNDDWSTSINAPCTYTITKAPVTVIANDVKREYGKENPEFTCSYFGFKNNETDSVLITKPTIATTATAESNVGTYPIIASSAEAKNYTFTYERGTLTITQASQAIEWEQTFEDVTVGDQLQLSATATSGLEVKYSVSDESIAEIYTSNGATFLDCLKAGDVTIKVNQSGDDNWAAADRVTKTITIKPKSGIENVAIPETDELSLTILGNDIVVNNAVRSSVEVYSISGAIIYSTQDYNGETISLSNGAYIVKVGNKTRKVVL